jgi:hypothetical protein
MLLAQQADLGVFWGLCEEVEASPSTSQALPSAIVSIAAAPMPIWVLKTYRKLEQNCRLLAHRAVLGGEKLDAGVRPATHHTHRVSQA